MNYYFGIVHEKAFVVTDADESEDVTITETDEVIVIDAPSPPNA